MAVQVKSADFQKDPIAREYGLRVHDQMEKVEGRVLDPPAMHNKGNETVRSHHAYTCMTIILYMFIYVCTVETKFSQLQFHG